MTVEQEKKIQKILRQTYNYDSEDYRFTWLNKKQADYINVQIKIYEKKSERSFEEEVKLSGFGAAPVKQEGAGMEYDSAQESFTARYTHETIAMGFSITDEEVAQQIQTMSVFNVEGGFNKQRYNQFVLGLLRPLGYSARQFEEHVRENLMIDRVQQLVQRSVLISPEEKLPSTEIDTEPLNDGTGSSY